MKRLTTSLLCIWASSALALSLPAPSRTAGASYSSKTLPTPAQDQIPAPKQTEKIYFPELKVWLYPFNAKNYDLAYKTFLANNNVEEAYIIAFAAVKQRPNNKLWNLRLAKVALWRDKPAIAMRQWYRLIDQFHDYKPLNKTIRLAEKLHATAYLEKLWAIKLEQKKRTQQR